MKLKLFGIKINATVQILVVLRLLVTLLVHQVESELSAYVLSSWICTGKLRFWVERIAKYRRWVSEASVTICLIGPIVVTTAAQA